MTQFVITNAGVAAAVAAGNGGIKVAIDHFKVGSVAGYAVDGTATDVNGLVYTGNNSQITYHVANDDAVVFHITLDQSVGDFNIGNIGLCLADGTVFAIGVLDAATTKRQANLPTTVGNVKTYDFLVVFSNIANIANLQILLPNECSLPVVADQTHLPQASNSVFDAFIVNTHTVYGAPAVAIAVQGAWYYALMELDPQTGNSVLFYPPALFASNVSIGNSCYWNAANGQFQRGDGLNTAVGVIGIRTSLNTITVVGKYVDAGQPYVAGASYYADGGANAGNLTTTQTNVYVGYARTTSELLINLNYAQTNGAGVYFVNTSIDSSGNVTGSLSKSVASGYPVGAIFVLQASNTNPGNAPSFYLAGQNTVALVDNTGVPIAPQALPAWSNWVSDGSRLIALQDLKTQCDVVWCETTIDSSGNAKVVRSHKAGDSTTIYPTSLRLGTLYVISAGGGTNPHDGCAFYMPSAGGAAHQMINSAGAPIKSGDLPSWSAWLFDGVNLICAGRFASELAAVQNSLQTQITNLLSQVNANYSAVPGQAVAALAASLPGGSIQGNGWWRDPNTGFTIEWGLLQTASGRAQVSYPRFFSTHFMTVCTDNGTRTWSSSNASWVGVDNVDNFGNTVDPGSGFFVESVTWQGTGVTPVRATVTVGWIAIGIS